MKTVERLLMKLALLQLIFLLIVQALHAQEPIEPHLNKTFLYEGVMNQKEDRVVETIDRSP